MGRAFIRISVGRAGDSAHQVHYITREPATNGEPHDDPLGVRRFVAALPPRQREVIFLRYFADLDYATIAHVLGLALGTVSATLSAAHHTLRARLEASPR